MSWKRERIWIACELGPQTVDCITYRGLALHRIDHGIWRITHCGTGLILCDVAGNERIARSITREIADGGDWGFDSMDGYKTVFPAAPDHLFAVMNAYPGDIIWKDRHDRKLSESASERVAALNRDHGQQEI